MNAYPAELIQHHYACMLVSGLLPGQAPIVSPETSRGAGEGKERQREPETVGGAGKESDSTESPASAAAASAAAAPVSPPIATPKTPTPAQSFPQMAKDLCDIFSSRGRNVAWDPSKSQSAVFHTVLVDNVRDRLFCLLRETHPS